MTFHPNSKKHKASHGGYYKKPTKQQVNATIDLYASLNEVPKPLPKNSVKGKLGVQLKLPF